MNGTLIGIFPMALVLRGIFRLKDRSASQISCRDMPGTFRREQCAPYCKKRA
jgi:hypothetical protein